MRFKSALLPLFVGGCIASLSMPVSAQSHLTCPLDWNALDAIGGPNPEKLILGLKASEWTKNDLDQMLAKEAECAQADTDSDASKKAYAKSVVAINYSNAIALIERRDKLIRQEARALEEQQKAQPAALAQVAEVPQPSSATVQQPVLERAAPQIVPTMARASDDPAKALRHRNLLIALGLVAASAGIWCWNRFVRNRCPSCKSTDIDCVTETEIDRWRGTKEVSERNSRGTKTRHVQATYVKFQFDYQCKHCQAEWSKQRKEELGNQSSFNRFLFGY